MVLERRYEVFAIKRSLAPLRNAKKKSIEISFLFICLKVENEVKKLLQLF